MIEEFHVVVEQGVHLLGVVERLGDGTLHGFKYLVAEKSFGGKTLVDVNNLVKILPVQELVDDIDAPNVLAEGEHSLNVRLGRDVAVAVFIATDTHVGNGIVIAHIFLELVEFHLFRTPTGLWRRQETTHRFQKVMERSRLWTSFCSTKSLYLSEIGFQSVNERFGLSQFATGI